MLASFVSVADAATAPGDDACGIDDISERLVQSNAYYEFGQTKSVAALSRPLNSRGVIWLSAKGELVWQLRSPIKSTTVMRASGVLEYNRRDELQPPIDNPVAADLSSVFLNILSGNFAGLAETFSHATHCSDGDWTIELTPIGEPFAGLLSSLSLSGRDTLLRIVYQESRGDVTEIQLTSSRRLDDSLEAYLED